MAALREASLESPLGNGLRAWFSAVSHRTKGCWDPCVFTGSSHCCLAQGCGHTGPEMGTRMATGPSLHTDGTKPPPPSRVGWEESNDVAARRPPTAAPEGRRWGGGVSRQPLSYGHFSHCFVFITTWVALQVNTALSGPEQPVLGRLSTQGPDWV